MHNYINIDNDMDLDIIRYTNWNFYQSLTYNMLKCLPNHHMQVFSAVFRTWVKNFEFSQPLWVLMWVRYNSSVQFSSVAQSCPTLCDPMNCSTPGLPVHHQLPEFTQTHVHRVGDAIQPSHPLLSPSPPAPNPSQHIDTLFWARIRVEWPKIRLHWTSCFDPLP